MELMSGDARWFILTSMLFVAGDTRPPVFSLVLSGIAKGRGRRLSRASEGGHLSFPSRTAHPCFIGKPRTCFIGKPRKP